MGRGGSVVGSVDGNDVRNGGRSGRSGRKVREVKMEEQFVK